MEELGCACTRHSHLWWPSFGWFWSQALLDASAVSIMPCPNIPDQDWDLRDADGQKPQTRHSTSTSLPSPAEQEGFVLISCSSSRVSIRVGRAGGLLWFPSPRHWKWIRFICIQKTEWRGRRVSRVVHPDGFFNSGGK